MLRKSFIDENILYRLVWEFITDTLILTSIFGTYIFFRTEIINDIDSSIILPTFFILVLIQLLFATVVNQKNLSLALNFFTYLIFIIMVYFELGDQMEYVVIEFFALLLIYIIFDAMLGFLENFSSPLIKGSISLLNFTLKLFFPIVLTYQLYSLEFQKYSLFQFNNQIVESELFVIYSSFNFLIFIISISITLALLTYRSSKLKIVSEKLRQISSWSIDEGVLEKDLLNDKVVLKNKTRTIVFGDVRGFTSFSEKNDIKDVVAILEYFYHIVEVKVKKYNGFKPEFIADEFLTFFDDTKKAVDFCFELRDEVNDFLEKYELGMGLGIDRGKVREGIVGSAGSKKYTVFGSNVNNAARLQSKAKKREILGSKTIINLVNGLKYDKIEGLSLKGVSSNFEIFNIHGYENTSSGILDKFKDTIGKVKNGSNKKRDNK